MAGRKPRRAAIPVIPYYVMFPYATYQGCNGGSMPFLAMAAVSGMMFADTFLNRGHGKFAGRMAERRMLPFAATARDVRGVEEWTLPKGAAGDGNDSIRLTYAMSILSSAGAVQAPAIDYVVAGDRDPGFSYDRHKVISCRTYRLLKSDGVGFANGDSRLLYDCLEGAFAVRSKSPLGFFPLGLFFSNEFEVVGTRMFGELSSGGPHPTIRLSFIPPAISNLYVVAPGGYLAAARYGNNYGSRYACAWLAWRYGRKL